MPKSKSEFFIPTDKPQFEYSEVDVDAKEALDELSKLTKKLGIEEDREKWTRVFDQLSKTLNDISDNLLPRMAGRKGIYDEELKDQLKLTYSIMIEANLAGVYATITSAKWSAKEIEEAKEDILRLEAIYIPILEKFGFTDLIIKLKGAQNALDIKIKSDSASESK